MEVPPRDFFSAGPAAAQEFLAGRRLPTPALGENKGYQMLKSIDKWQRYGHIIACG